MKIADILNKSCIRVPLENSDKTAVITELVDLLSENDQIADRDSVLSAILAREETRSTGIGEGLAVPHGKSNGCAKLTMAVGKPATPIDFAGRDGKPCELIFLLASPTDKMGPHIQALACISRIWLNHDFRKAVASAQNADDLYTAIEHFQA